ncbi:class III extradiol ring-cleavage dioxygenase family protein [Nocardia thraciensis]
MFRVAVLIPSPPVLVPELCGGLPVDAPEHPAAQVPPLREAVVSAGRALANRARSWTVVGVGDEDRVLGPDAGGTFRGFGADVRVALSDAAHVDATADPELPLAVLVGAWLRGQVAADAVARARIVDAAADPRQCLDLGATLRKEMDAIAEPCGVLVVADGAATLSTRAPGYLDPRAEGVQQRIDTALAAGDRSALAALDPALCADIEARGRAAYQVLAGLFAADGSDPDVETRYAAAPFGVGYQVSVWRPGASS